MRRRVKEQLKKMGGLEYWDVNFSYSDRETGSQTFVSLPEGGSGQLISGETMPAGSVYTIASDPSDRRLALFLIQTQVNGERIAAFRPESFGWKNIGYARRGGVE